MADAPAPAPAAGPKAPPASFVHLHLHSDYSLLDGANKVKQIVALAQKNNMDAVALTDHGVMFGALEFYKMALAAGVKPIIGCEIYVAPRERTLKMRLPGEPDAYHLTLLAESRRGYENLCRLSTEGYLTGFYTKPRVDRALIREHHEGLIGLSGCLKSEVCDRLLKGRFDEALEIATFYRDTFGEGRYYIELMDHGLKEQAEVTKGLLEIARRLSVPYVATNDVHYPEKGDDRVHEVLLCINTGKTLESEKRMRLSTDEFYFKSAAEMEERFRHLPEAIANTRKIAAQCHVDIDLKTMHLPVFKTPDGSTPEEYFRRIACEGLRRRYPEITPAIRERFEEEFAVIRQMGFISYFLITWDFIHHAKEQGIPVGPGRGSAAGSVVAYAVGITDIDPIPYDLLFERFLNKARVTMPDIDIDFCQDRRGEVIEYVRKKYGEECVSQIITFNVMKAKQAIRDVGRVMGLPLPLVDQVAKLVPDGHEVTLAKTLEQEADLRNLYEADPTVHSLIDMAQKIEGLARHAGVHAAGVVIGDGPLVERVPLYVGKEGLATQYSMGYLEEVGLLKMDFLGLRTLTLIENCLRLIKKSRGVDLDIRAIPLDDPKSFALLQRADALGVFQMESSGFRDLLVKLRPDKFEDLIALVALYRPGPLGSGLVDSFCRRKHGQEKVTYLHPKLADCLEETYGVCVYQEQAMRITNRLAGFSLSDADTLRKAMGKKKPEIMAKYEAQFLSGSEKNGVPREIASQIWAQLEQFAHYAFNKSHSAAYAYVAYQTAYLKANYPVEFMAALLTSYMSKTEKIVEYVAEAERMGIHLIPPDANTSDAQFGVSNGRITYGLLGIKGLGGGAVESILAARAKLGRFRTLLDMAEEVDLHLCNRLTFEALIKAGALDGLGGGRAGLMVQLDRVLAAGADAQADRQAGQRSLFGGGGPVATAAPAPPPPAEVVAVPEWPDAQRLKAEKEVLGFYLSGHPVDRRAAELRAFAPQEIAALRERLPQGKVAVGALVTEIRKRLDKRGTPMAFLTIEDRSGTLDAVIFSRVFGEAKEKLVPDAILVFVGELQADREESPPPAVEEVAPGEEGEGAPPRRSTRRISLLVDEVLTLEEAPARLATNVLIALPSERLDDETLGALRETLAAFRGASPVFLSFPAARGSPAAPRGVRVRVRVGRDYFVRPDESFRAAVTALLCDPGAVAVGAVTT